MPTQLIVLQALLALTLIGNTLNGPLYARDDVDNPSRRNWQAPNISPIKNLNFSSVNSIIHTDKAIDELKKKLRFRPLIEVNTNRGALKTTFSIPLPPNLTDFKALTFQYNSRFMQNIGMGIGWQISLPFIDDTTRFAFKKPFYIRGPLGNSELVYTKEVITPTPLLNQLSKKLSINRPNGNITYRSLRYAIESQYHQVIQISANKKLLGFLLQKNNHQWWLFDSSGLPIMTGDQFQNTLSFIWDEAILKKIIDTENKWTASINYLTQQDIPTVQQNFIKHLPKGIQNITISRKNLERHFNFTYTEEYLKKVTIPQSVLPIFQAQYAYFPKIKKKPEVLSNEFTADDQKKSVFFNSLKEPISESVKSDDAKNILFVDLNGDGRDDKIVIDNSKVMDNIQHYLNTMKYKTSGRNYTDCYARIVQSTGEISNHINSFRPEVNIFMALWDGNKTGYQLDKYLSQELFIRTVKFKVTKPLTSGEGCRNIETLKVDTEKMGINFVDFNGDGFKDLLLCTQSPVEDEKFMTYGKQKWRQSNMALSVLDKLGVGEQITGQYTNYFKQNIKTSPGKIWINKIDPVRWRNIIKNSDNELPLTSAKNYIMGVASFKPAERTIPCHTGSIVSDVNNDGAKEVINGNEVIAVGKNLLFKKMHLSDDKINIFFSLHEKKFDLANERVLLADYRNEGKLSPLSAREAVGHPLSGKILVIKNKETLLFTPGSRHKLISFFQAPFGGHIEVKYQFQDGHYAPSSLLTNPNEKKNDFSQPIFLREFYYDTPIKDPYSGILIGYAKTREIQRTDHSNSTPSETINYFTRDINPKIFLYKSRSRLNGILYRKEINKLHSRTKLKIETYSPGIIPLGMGRILSFSNEKNIYLNNTYVQSSTINYPDWHYFDKLKLFPKKIKKTVAANKGLTNLYTHDLHLHYFEIDENYNYNKSLGSGHLELKTESGKNGLSYRPPLKIERNGLGLVKSIQQGDSWQQFSYDSSGRIILQKDSTGAYKNARYWIKTPLIKFTKDNYSFANFDYNLLTGQLMTAKDTYNNIIKYEYTSDGILKNQFKNDISFYKFNPPKRKDCPNSDFICLENKFKISILDSEKEILVDGLGRMTQTMQFNNDDDKVFSAMSIFNENDLPLVRYFPQQNVFGDNVERESNYYDALSRLKFQEKGTYRKDYSYNGNCLKTFENGLTFKECQNGLGKIISSNISGDNVILEYNYLGEVLAIDNLNTRWNYSPQGDITDSIGRQSSSVNWEENRILKRAGLNRQYTNGFMVEYDHRKLPVASSQQYRNPHEIEEKHIYNKMGQLIKQTFSFLQKGFAEKIFTYDPSGRLESESFFNTYKLFAYDQFDRLAGIHTQFSDKDIVSKKLSYKNNLLDAVAPFIKKIDYNQELLPVKYHYWSGLSIEYFRDKWQRVQGKIYSYKRKALFSEALSRDGIACGEQVKFDMITEKSHFTPPTNIQTQNICYNRLQLKNQKSEFNFYADRRFVHKIENNLFNWTRGNLTTSKISKKSNHYYDLNGQLLMSCPDHIEPQENHPQCFYRLNNEEIIISGKYIKLIKAGQEPIAIQYNNEYAFPIAVDHLGTLIGIFSPNGKTLLFQRIFDQWGNKKSVKYTATENFSLKFLTKLEKMIAWSFAGLMHNPLLEQNRALQNHPNQTPQLYWSQSRVYSPSIKQWMSVDPTLIWNPNKLSTTNLDWFGMRYCNNDPINFVDPTGHAACGGLCLTAGGALATGAAIGLKRYRQQKASNYIQNYIDQIDTAMSPITDGNQSMVTGHKALKNLQVKLALNVTKDAIKDAASMLTPKSANIGFFESIGNFLKELFSRDSYDEVRDQADKIMDSVNMPEPKTNK